MIGEIGQIFSSAKKFIKTDLLDDLKLAIENNEDAKARELISQINIGKLNKLDPNTDKMLIVLKAAVEHDKLDILLLLLEKQPKFLNASKGEDMPLAHYAAALGRLNILKKLLSLKPDLMSFTMKGEMTIFDFAMLANRQEAMKFLVTLKPDLINNIDKFRQIIILNRSEFIDFILSSNPEITDVKSKEGHNILHMACTGGRYKIAKKFLAIKPGLINEKDNSGESVLHLMTQVSSAESIKLLRYLINIKPELSSTKSNSDITLLHVAVIYSNFTRVRVLMSINPELIDEVFINSGYYKTLSALEIACAKGNFAILTYLISRGAYFDLDRFERFQQEVQENSKLSEKEKQSFPDIITITKDVSELLKISYSDNKSIGSGVCNDHIKKMYDSNNELTKLFLTRLKHLWMRHVKAGDKILNDFEAALISHKENVPEELYQQACDMMSRLKEGLVDIKALAKTVVEHKGLKGICILPKYYSTIRFFKGIDLIGLRKLLPDLSIEQV